MLLVKPEHAQIRPENGRQNEEMSFSSLQMVIMWQVHMKKLA